RWAYVYLRRDELTPEAAPPQQQWVLVLVLRPLPPPLQQRPLPPLLLPPLLLPLKPKRTPRFHGQPALAFADPNVAKPDLVAVVLQTDVPSPGGLDEASRALEFTRGHAGLEIRGSELVLDDGLLVLPQAHTAVIDLDFHVVPFAGGARVLGVGRNEVIERPCLTIAVHTELGIGMSLVIEDLHLGC